MTNWTGVNQNHSWEQTQAVARKYVNRGYEVMNRSKEHERIEYEVYVDFME
jgi:hypothetical protein